MWRTERGSGSLFVDETFEDTPAEAGVPARARGCATVALAQSRVNSLLSLGPKKPRCNVALSAPYPLAVS